MIINSIKITNFRCYYGTNSLAFNSNGKIALIYGDSGYGKSSLLQFFRWMFYGDYDFGKNDDKPLFNINAYKECKIGDKVEVAGQIDFEHLGVAYRLNRSTFYSIAFKMENSSVDSMECQLHIKSDDGGYHPFNGDIANQINTILPKELSKYFLLDGERARDIVLNSTELKKAIHSLFGLDIYKEAIAHIGKTDSKTTVLGHYANQFAKHASVNNGQMSLADLQEAVQVLYEKIEKTKEKHADIVEKINQSVSRREEILKNLGAATSKDKLSQLIKIKQQKIKDNDKQIEDIRLDIGDYFYQTYPYLLLAKNASETVDLLRRKNEEYASKYKNIFDNLKKDLLEEILKKDICVCGRQLDLESKDHIEGIIATMPPDSYLYSFGQYVSKAKKHIQSASESSLRYENLTNRIAELEEENRNLDNEIQEELNDLRRFDDVKELIDDLDKLKYDIQQLEGMRDSCLRDLSQDEKTYAVASKKLKEERDNAQVSKKFKGDLDFFEKLVGLLNNEKDIREAQVKKTLNNCVRNIFKKLTTQTELDADNVQFINDDFSLRTTYLTGGQLAVDVYSYVIGIIKALQECQMDNNENPIIIDAPFAFTGNTQSEHIFKTLPTVSRQTILLTLDLNKIKNLLHQTDLYDFYIIKNDTQEKATIVPGGLNDINI